MNQTGKPMATSGNAIADILVQEGRFDIFGDGSKVAINKNDILYAGLPEIDFIYFPIDLIVSLVCDLSSGYSAEFMQIGCDGMVGVSALMDGHGTRNTAIAQTSGNAYRVPVAAIQQAFDASANFRRAILRYMQALMQESAQRIVCSRHHSVQEQFCRALLLASDRLKSDNVSLTHEQLSLLIGCRRGAVSMAASKIQAAGLIDYAYGRITILNRSGLEDCCCECYGVIRQAFAGFLPNSDADQVLTH